MILALVLLTSILASTAAIAHADTLGLKSAHSPFTEIDRRGRHHKKG